MKEKKFSIGDYELVMQTPKHSAIMSAELNAMDTHPLTGMPYVNNVKFRFNRTAAAIKSVIVKGKGELIKNVKDSEKFLNDLDEDQYLIVDQAYLWLVSNKEYEAILKNFVTEDSSPSSTPQ